jgi:hypothetical protein
MNKLRTALDDLATDAPRPGPAPHLWRSGIRRRRRTRLLAGAPALPDRIHPTSGWLRGTDDVGAPGSIAALFWDNARRTTFWGGSQGYVAISADDGSYRYLDVPGLGATVEPVLSPDGRYVAYPTAAGGEQVAEADRMIAEGYSVYDARTGKVLRHEVSGAPRGIWGEPPRWTPDSSILLMDVCRVVESGGGGSSCRSERTDAWEVASGDTWSLPAGLTQEWVGRSDDQLVRLIRGGRLSTLDERTGTWAPQGRVDTSAVQSPELLRLDEAAGSVLFAGLVGGDAGDLALGAARTDGSPAQVRRDLGPDYAEALGLWRPGWVAALTLRDERRAVEAFEVAGEGSSVLIEVEDGFNGSDLQFAEDLLARPLTEGRPPESPADPRILAGAGAVILAGGALLVVGWRRRRSAVAMAPPEPGGRE